MAHRRAYQAPGAQSRLSFLKSKGPSVGNGRSWEEPLCKRIGIEPPEYPVPQTRRLESLTQGACVGPAGPHVHLKQIGGQAIVLACAHPSLGMEECREREPGRWAWVATCCRSATCPTPGKKVWSLCV